MGVNGLSVQRYGCEGETSRNCFHHAGRQPLNRTSLRTFCPPLRRSYPAGGSPLRNVSSMCDFLEEIARHKLFSAHFLEEIARHKTFSAYFLRKSAATKLFRLISSGNRPPQNCFGPFPQEIGRHKLFRLISSGNRPPQNCFGSFPQEIGRHKTVSAHFLRKSAAHLLTHFLRKSAATYSLISSGNRLPRTSSFPQEIGRSLTHSFPQEIVGWPTSNSRFRRCTSKGTFLMRSPCPSSPNRLNNTVSVRFFLHLAIRSRSGRFQS